MNKIIVALVIFASLTLGSIADSLIQPFISEVTIQVQINDSIDAVLPDAYDHGLWIDFVNVTQNVIHPGQMMVNGTLFTLSSSVTQTLVSLDTDFDIPYWYLDFSASTASSPVFYDTTNEPIELVSQGAILVAGTSQTDRLIGFAYGKSGVANLAVATGHADGRYWCVEVGVQTGDLAAESAANPDGTFRIMGTRLADTIIPVGATEAYFNAIAGDTGNRAFLRLVTETDFDRSVSSGGATRETIWRWDEGTDATYEDDWIPCDEERNYRWFGEDNDNNVVNFWIVGANVMPRR